MKPLQTWYKNPLFYFHILTHLSIIPMILYSNWYHWGIAIFMYYMFGCWGVAITYHRLISHRSFKSPKWFSSIGLVLGSLGGVGSSIQWIGVHRQHHRWADTENDPHNPAGSFWQFLKMQFLTMIIDARHSPRYVPDLLRDKLHLRLHKYYWLIHAIFGIILFLIDPFALIYAYLFPVLILWHVTSALGTFAHTPKFGTQPNSQKDKSTNLWFLGWMAFGEGWHNNHHTHASDWRFGKQKWEFDLSAIIINLIKI
jgi:fatty-acid desaturase